MNVCMHTHIYVRSIDSMKVGASSKQMVTVAALSQSTSKLSKIRNVCRVAFVHEFSNECTYWMYIYEGH